MSLPADPNDTKSVPLAEMSVQGSVDDGPPPVSQGGKPKKEKKASSHLYSYGTMIGIAINYIVGTGALSLAVTMGNVGVLMTIVILVVGSATTLFLAIYFTEVLARAYALARSGHAPEYIVNKLREYENPVNTNTEVSSSSAVGGEPTVDGPSCGYVKHDYSLSTECEFCNSELMKMFYGKAGFYIYQVSNIIYFFGTVWSYGNVVASSLTSIIPMYGLPSYKKLAESNTTATWECSNPTDKSFYEHCNQSFWIWICVAMVIACVLIFFDLSQQKILQTIFTGCRFATLALVLIFTVVAYARGPYDPGNAKGHTSTSVKLYETHIYWIATQFSSIVFCQVCHHSIPEIIRPVKREHHHKINFAFTITYMVIFIITSLILFMCGSYFGGNSNSLLTLNFTEWDGKVWGNCIKDKSVNWATVVAYIIRALPPIYVTTAIPINSLTMANNILSMFPLHLQKKLWLIVLIKLLSIIPAMLMAGFVKNLSQIVSFAGLTGFVIISVSALMLIKGRKLCKQHFGEENVKTPYDSWTSKLPIIYIILAINGIGFALTTYSVIADAAGFNEPKYGEAYVGCNNASTSK